MGERDHRAVMSTHHLSEEQSNRWRIAALAIGGIGNVPLILVACILGNAENTALGLLMAVGCFGMGHGTFRILLSALARYGHSGCGISLIGPIGWALVSIYLAGGLTVTASI